MDILRGIGLLGIILNEISGTSQNGLSVPGFVLACTGDSIIFTCLYNRGKGSVLLASLYHSAYDGIISSMQGLFPALITQMYLSLIAEVLVVLLVIALTGGLSLGRDIPTRSRASHYLIFSVFSVCSVVIIF